MWDPTPVDREDSRMLRVVAMADWVSGSDGIAAMDAVAGVACVLMLLVLVLPIALLFIQTSVLVRVLTLGGAVFYLFGSWLTVFHPKAQLPLFHPMVSLVMWSIAACRQWLWSDFPMPPPGRCKKCGYDLTGNVSGVCPECGTLVPKDTGSKTGRS